jgi:hypothetical protein
VPDLDTLGVDEGFVKTCGRRKPISTIGNMDTGGIISFLMVFQGVLSG